MTAAIGKNGRNALSLAGRGKALMRLPRSVLTPRYRRVDPTAAWQAQSDRTRTHLPSP